MTVFPQVLDQISRDAKAPKSMMSVLIWCWNNLDHSSWKQFRQLDVAEYLNVSITVVNRSLQYLEEAGFIIRHGKGTRQAWQLTPESCWKSYAGSWHVAMRNMLAHKSKSTKKEPELYVVGGKAMKIKPLTIANNEGNDNA
jgi:transcription initiation factor IIE alpha subunit